MSLAASDNAALRVAAAASSDGAIITQDLTGTITSWNRAAEQIFGHSSAEAVGESIRLIVPPELQGENDDMQRRIKAGESFDHYDTVRIRRDGRQIDVTLTVSPLATAGGEIVGASRISRVITERKRLERFETIRSREDGSPVPVSLTVSPIRSATGTIAGISKIARELTVTRSPEAFTERERLAALVDASPDFIAYADPKTTQIKYINKGGRRMCGIGEDEDIGTLTIADLHPAWMNQRMAEVALPAAVRDGLWEGDGAFLHRGGHEIPVSMALLAHRGADGDVDFFYTVSRDATERNRGVDALRITEERMRFALEAAGLGIWDINNTTGVIRWSALLEAQYGLQPGTFGGSFEAMAERIHPDDRALVHEAMERAMTSGADFSVQNRTIWPDGTVRWLSGAGKFYLGEHGEPVRGVGISQDVTGRKRTDETLQRHNDEIQLQRMRVFKATIRTVQDIVNNLLNGFQLVRLEGEAQLPAELLALVDRMVEEAGVKLKTLGDLETVNEKEMTIGTGIDYPGGGS